MALVRMKPPVGVSVGLGADKKLYYVDDKGYANVDSGSVTKLTGEGWVSAVPVAPEAPNNFAVMASKTLSGAVNFSLTDGNKLPAHQAVTQAYCRPWRLATFGDSRVNTGSTGPDVGGSQLMSNLRLPGWVSAFLQDAEIVRNYGVSGDAAVNWNASNRTGGKTFADLNSQDVDGVICQYGINDAMASTPAATIFSALKALATEVMKGGKVFFFESTNPINSAMGGGYAAVQTIADATNALMKDWLANFPNSALYIDTASSLKDATGYANPVYYNTDGIHFIQPGAYFAGKIVAAAIRTMFLRRAGAFVGSTAASPNLLNLLSPSSFLSVEAGTVTGSNVVSGADANGYYTEFSWTPATAVSGETRVRCELSVNFQTSSQPAYALVGQEILQASGRVICDEGAGGKPNAYAVSMRERFYTAAVFRDWGTIPPGAPTALTPDLYEALDIRLTTPSVQNTAASVVANPSSGTGLQVQVFVSSQNIGVPVRLRIYNAQIKVVGYNKTPVSVTPPASGAAWTNQTTVNQQVTISGGTVSAIAQNGVSTGLTTGQFVLAPGDTLTPTYTVAPTMLVKHF